MPKSKEYVSTDEDSSEEEVKSKKRKPKKAEEKVEEKEEKVAKKVKKESNDSDDSVWDLGNNRQVSVSEFKGKLYVNIREMYYDKDANLKPGKKGICLSMPQWRKLLAVIEDVDKAVKAKS